MAERELRRGAKHGGSPQSRSVQGSPARLTASEFPPGLTAFILHCDGGLGGKDDFIADIIASKGFELLLVHPLDPDRAAAAADLLSERGSVRWMPRGAASPMSRVLFYHDLIPLTPKPDQLMIAPSCDNARIFSVMNAVGKEAVRLTIESHLGGVSATQNAGQAWALAQLLVPGRTDEVAAQVRDMQARFELGPALRNLSGYACRARVEVVEHNGGVAVRKTFRPGAERFMQRELEVFAELGPICPEIPKLLAQGPNYFITEFIDDADQSPLPPSPFPLPLATVRQLARFVRTCLARGFDPIDLKPFGNVIYSRSGLKVIDYEFWRLCDPQTPAKDSFCLAGVPKDFDGDHPRGLHFVFNPYERKWRRLTGLPLQSFLEDPAWLQAIKRSLSLAVWLARHGARAMKARIAGRA